MWKSACVGVYQLLKWKMHGETLKNSKTIFFMFRWGPPTNGVKSRKLCHHVQVYKTVENSISRNIRLGLYCVIKYKHFTLVQRPFELSLHNERRNLRHTTDAAVNKMRLIHHWKRHYKDIFWLTFRVCVS